MSPHQTTLKMRNLPHEHHKLYHCRGLKSPMDQVWPS